MFPDVGLSSRDEDFVESVDTISERKVEIGGGHLRFHGMVELHPVHVGGPPADPPPEDRAPGYLFIHGYQYRVMI